MKTLETITLTCKGPNRLAEILQKQNMTQKQLAALSGLTESQISRMVSGERSGRIDTWFKISKVLHVTIDDLICTDEIHYIGGANNAQT